MNIEPLRSRALAAVSRFRDPVIRTRLETEVQTLATQIQAITRAETQEKLAEDLDDYVQVLKAVAVLANRDFARCEAGKLRESKV